jgi:ATP/maltotriose-dependent transcriptional regulator MalT
MHSLGDTRRKLRAASLLTDQAWLEIARTLRLTKREVQIVQGVFDNLPKTGIARRLQISDHTVHTHLNRLFTKLAVTTRTELVLRIMEQMLNLTRSETGVLPPVCRLHHAIGCSLVNPPAAPPAKT